MWLMWCACTSLEWKPDDGNNAANRETPWRPLFSLINRPCARWLAFACRSVLIACSASQRLPPRPSQQPASWHSCLNTNALEHCSGEAAWEAWEAHATPQKQQHSSGWSAADCPSRRSTLLVAATVIRRHLMGVRASTEYSSQSLAHGAGRLGWGWPSRP